MTQRCGLTGENLVTPVCWTGPGAAQLAACAWDNRVRVCCQNRWQPRRGRPRRLWLSSRSPPGHQHPPGDRQSAASQPASRSIARWRICGDGGISGLGGCKIGSRPGPVQAGNAGPRSP